jgi:hypothetical protein
MVSFNIGSVALKTCSTYKERANKEILYDLLDPRRKQIYSQIFTEGIFNLFSHHGCYRRGRGWEWKRLSWHMKSSSGGSSEAIFPFDFKLSPYSDCCVFLLGNSPASEFYIPTFRNTLYYLHLQVPAYEDGTECSETWRYKIQTPGNYPEESIKLTPCSSTYLIS